MQIKSLVTYRLVSSVSKAILQKASLGWETAFGGLLWRNAFLKIWQNLKENTCARVSFLINFEASPAILLKKRLWHSCFRVNSAKFLRTPFFYWTPPVTASVEWSLMHIIKNTWTLLWLSLQIQNHMIGLVWIGILYLIIKFNLKCHDTLSNVRHIPMLS